MIKSLISLIRTSVSQIGFLFVATVTGYTLTYLYLVAMGRLLGPEAFGILGALFAVFYIATVVGQALRQAIAVRVAEVKAQAGEAAATGAYLKLVKKLIWLYVLPALAFVLLSKTVAGFFNIASAWPVVILAFALSIALCLDTVLSLQQGLQEFKLLGITGFYTAQGLKLLFGVVFVLIGWGLPGAMGALLASTGAAIFVGLSLLRKKLAVADHATPYSLHVGKIIGPALIMAVVLSMPATIDVMLVAHFFAGADAGLYNAVATVGKVVFFLPMAVSFVLLPKASESHAVGADSRHILLRSLALAFMLSGTVALVCWLFPGIIIRLFFGHAYIGAAALMGWYVAAMLVFSLNVVLMHYSLAVRNLRLMFFADVVTLAEVLAIIAMHQSLLSIIWIMAAGNLLVLLVSLPVLLRVKGKQ